MKTIPLLIAGTLFAMLNFTRLYAQSGSTSKGTEFWTAYMDHVNTATGNSPSKMILYITSDASTSGSVSFADGTTAIPFTVTPNTVTFVDIPPAEFLGSAGQFLKGIHVTSLKPIAVYAHIYASSVSGATLLLPVNTLGKNYYSLNYTQKSNANPSYSTFVIVATEDGTQVQITPSAALTTGQSAGAPFVINLQKGEVYQGLSLTDLTGTRIQSVSTTTGTCKRIAVFSGSTKLGIGCSAASSLSSDNLFQQVYPTSSWGKNYVTVALMNRPYDIFRIVLSDPATNVTLNGQPIPAGSFTNGFYYEFNTNTTGTVTNTISADKPIQVVQYTPTQNQTLAANCAVSKNDVGDPEMIYLSPIEQGLDHVTLYSTGYYNITQSYINVVIPTSAASSFTLDGTPYTLFTPVSGNTAYSYAQIPVTSGPRAAGGAGTVTSGTHNIAASQPFNAIAYGFGGTESYGYSAGTNLQDLNEFIKLQDVQTSAISSSGCAGVSYKPRISIPYQTTSISWDLKDGNPPVVDNAPVIVDQTQKGNVTIYSYEYPGTPIQYNTAGSYTIVATVLNPNSSDCGSTEDIEFDFSVSDVPAANFTAQASACLNDNVTFTDNTNNKGIATQTWAWDFADAANSTTANPNTATTKNATHTFTKAGDYMVSLTVTNQNGCSNTFQQKIHINASPQAGFHYSATDCETRGITFTDTSVPGEGTLSKWDWDFGDGTTEPTHTNATPFTHQFAAAGTYNVKLTVTSSTGCPNNITQPITIHPLPQVDFSLPDACVNDNTQFNDLSTIADHTEAQFTYLWDFGDPASGTNNTSTLKNPLHHFTHTNGFSITLTVTSKYGCSSTKNQQFTVNGGTPVADFTPQNSGSLCSVDDVLFFDNSNVNPGNITKLVWYFDAVNQPNQSVTYTRDQFPADKIYHHNYGTITTATPYTVMLVAYSGDACQSVITHQVTVKPSPTVTLTPIGPLCQEDSPVQIQATPANGVTGTSTFNGAGVSTSGLFNPTTAGPGTFTINYNFVANNLCTYNTTMHVVVHANPTINVPSEIHLLDGGQVTLNATASGDQPLTYHWTLKDGSKATGLDHDDVAQPIASPSNDITYMLTVTSANNCPKSAFVDVIVLKAPVVPNAFTPNSDGVNDTWNIKYMDSYPNCTIDVYNRYGEKLYSSIGYPQPWDGTYRGAQLPAGTYYYIINPKNGRKVISGSVTIIR